jgi:hypothetical protein
VRSEVLTMVIMDVTPCSLIENYQLFGEKCCLYLEGRNVFYSGDGSIKFFRNVDAYLPNSTASRLVRSKCQFFKLLH